MKWKDIPRSQKVFIWSLCGLITVVILFPFMYIISLSLAEFKDSFRIICWPLHFKWGNYIKAVETINISGYYRNSFVVTIMSVSISLLVGAPAAYAFARFQFRGKELLYTFFLLGIMVPAQALIVPLFLTVKTLRLLNNYLILGFIYPSLNLAFTLFILRGFFATVPHEIVESAIIDGCSLFQAFWQIVIPVSRPGLAAVALFQFIWSWDEFLIAFTFITDDSKMTLPAGVARLQGEYFTDYPVLGATLVLASVLIIIFYLLAQRQFIQGLTLGALKE